MNKPNFTQIFNVVRAFTVKHSPEILTGIGIAGMITTTVLAVKATPKAIKKIEEVKEANHTENEKMKPVDVVKNTWKYYVPATVTGVASVTCLIGANNVHLRRNAALAAAYKLSETALSEYKDKVIETIGEKKEKVVREKVNEDKIKNNPVSKNEVYITKKGETLCFDPLSGRYFKSSIDAIKKAVNDLNAEMLSSSFGYTSLNELYDRIGLDDIEVGELLGWQLDCGAGQIDISFDTKIAEDNEPCIVLEYETPPKYDFTKFY